VKKIFLTDNADSIADSNSEYPGLQGCMNAVSGNLNNFSRKLEEINPDISSTKSRILRRIEELLQYAHPESNGFYHSKSLAEVTRLNN